MTYEQVIVPLRKITLLYHTLIQKKRTIHRRSADGVEMISHQPIPFGDKRMFHYFREESIVCSRWRA